MSSEKKEIPLPLTGFEADGPLLRQCCDHIDCDSAGLYRAPRSREAGVGYFWLCLDHVRAFNAAWDYFDGWDENKIARYREEAVTGHRPTWKIGQQDVAWGQLNIDDRFEIFAQNGETCRSESVPPMPKQQREAHAILNLDGTASLQEIKMRYKQLVKRLHPDVNGGDKKAEERFKAVTEAYDHLLACGYY